MRVMAVSGYSGSGKTTLLEKLLPWLIEQGLSVSLIKQTHHDVDLDQPGKDSWRHRQAGASEVMLVSDARWALLAELRDQPRPSLPQLLQHLSPVDLVLLEGFKAEPVARLEVYRPALGRPLLQAGDSRVLGVASDVALDLPVPVLMLDDIPAIGQFVIRNAEEIAGKS